MTNAFYEAPQGNIVTRAGLKFLEALDLSVNLVKVTLALKGVPNGAVSLLLAVGAFFALLGFGSLAFYFDISSSWTAMEPLRVRVLTVLAGVAGATFFGWLVQFVPTALTVLPTVSEALGARFARFNIPAFQAVTWLFIGWDLATDIPRVNENVNPLWAGFVQNSEATGFFGILLTGDLRIIGGAIGFYVVWVMALLGASYFLELVTMLLVWAVFALGWKSLGYWGKKLLSGTRTPFSGDLAGDFDADYQGDEHHSGQAASFGRTASRRAATAPPGGKRSARSGRGTPPPPAPGRSPRSPTGAQPLYEEDLFDDEVSDDEEWIKGGGVEFAEEWEGWEAEPVNGNGRHRR